MINMIVTLTVCSIITIANIYFYEKEKTNKEKKKKKQLQIENFYNNEIKNIKISLAGIGIDENSDFEFKKAIEKAKLSNDTRIKI